MLHQQILRGTLTLLLVSLFVASTPPVETRRLVADKKGSVITYAMRHPMHSWEGVSHDVNCAVTYNDASKQIEAVAVSVKLASFDSGNANRDSHGLEVMDALKYPSVTFVSQKVQATPTGLALTGTLTFHGVARPVVVQATRVDGAKSLTVDGKFDVSLTAHQIERPSLMAMKTDDEVKLHFLIQFPL